MKLVVVTFFLACIAVGLLADAHPSASASDRYRRADSVAAIYQGHSLINLKNLSDRLTKPFDNDYDKFRAIYKWVCDNIENDYELFMIHENKRARLPKDEFDVWNRKFGNKVFKQLIQERKTVCTGYAWLIRELAQHAGLACVVVDGYGRTASTNVGGKDVPNHSWNAVQLNNTWYLCDATWSSGFVDLNLSMFIKSFNEGYFLASPEQFLLNHYPLDSRWMLTDNKLTLHDFLNSPLPYRGAFEQELIPVYPSTYEIRALKGETIHINFKTNSRAPVKEVSVQTNRSRNFKDVGIPFTKKNGIYQVDYVLPNKGSYDIYVRVNGFYVFAYHVTVI